MVSGQSSLTKLTSKNDNSLITGAVGMSNNSGQEKPKTSWSFCSDKSMYHYTIHVISPCSVFCLSFWINNVLTALNHHFDPNLLKEGGALSIRLNNKYNW